MENKEIKRLLQRHPTGKLEFWTGDGNTYYCEWNSVRKDYPGGCVDVKCKGGHMTYLFHMDGHSIKPAFNWKEGTSELAVVEAYLENCHDSIWETMEFMQSIEVLRRLIK